MKRALLFILSLLMVSALLSPVFYVFGASADDYEKQLVTSGFPEDYASKLARLHDKHPDWSFVPVDVTGLSSGGQYTWDYVIKMETDEAKRSLISSSDTYTTQRDFLNAELYDSGWYKASVGTVEYLMDPRNFLDEKQIFQFIELGWNESITLSAVQTAVRGTFMENAKLDDKYSDTTYAEYFMAVGKNLGINPVYIAATCRNEQGVNGTSPLISGSCGDKLWYYYSNKITDSENGKLIKAPTSGYTEESLKAYNGLYNYFNIGAAGTGYFQIYLGGMKEAQKGTADKAAEWGDGGAWNTRWKAIYGGAATATSRYVNDFQNTFYFQKFNVDPRSSRNFWGQYMQNVYGSYSKAASFYTSFSEGGLLDIPYTFVIPVFKGMPESCPLPDGTEFAKRSLLTDKNVESYELMNLADITGVKSNYSAEKISWRVLRGQSGKNIGLGKIDLSQYSSAIIEYSVSEKFDSFSKSKNALIGFVFDVNHPLGTKDGDADNAALLGSTRMKDGGNGGYMVRKYAVIDLGNVAHNGDVYLSAYLSSGESFIVHNIAFLKKTGYSAPAGAEYTVAETSEAAPESSAPADESSSDAPDTEDTAKPGTNGCKSASEAFAVIAAAAVLPSVTRKKRRNP